MNEQLRNGNIPEGPMQESISQRDRPMEMEACCEKSPTTPIREVKIQPLHTGFIVSVGCRNVAVSSKKQLIEELTKYYTDPADTEKRYYSGEFGDKNEI